MKISERIEKEYAREAPLTDEEMLDLIRQEPDELGRLNGYVMFPFHKAMLRYIDELHERIRSLEITVSIHS